MDETHPRHQGMRTTSVVAGFPPFSPFFGGGGREKGGGGGGGGASSLLVPFFCNHLSKINVKSRRGAFPRVYYFVYWKKQNKAQKTRKPAPPSPIRRRTTAAEC